MRNILAPLGISTTCAGPSGLKSGIFVARVREVEILRKRESNDARVVPGMWHGGSSLGFKTHILRIPEKRLTVVIPTNRNEGQVAALARNVADSYLFQQQ